MASAQRNDPQASSYARLLIDVQILDLVTRDVRRALDHA
jgi:hypothetical protein